MGIQEIIEAWKGETLEELLRDMYIEKDMSIRDISKELFISVGMVHAYLHKFSICKQNDMWIIE